MEFIQSLRFLSYDPSTYLLLLMDPPHGLLVDISLCLDPSQSLSFLNENKGTLMVIGTLERSEVGLTILPPVFVLQIQARVSSLPLKFQNYPNL